MVDTTTSLYDTDEITFNNMTCKYGDKCYNSHSFADIDLPAFSYRNRYPSGPAFFDGNSTGGSTVRLQIIITNGFTIHHVKKRKNEGVVKNLGNLWILFPLSKCCIGRTIPYHGIGCPNSNSLSIRNLVLSCINHSFTEYSGSRQLYIIWKA